MGSLLVAMATMWVSGRADAQTPPRAVAVVDATVGPTSDPEAAALAQALEAQIDTEDDLVLVATERRPALIGGVPDETEAARAEASAALARARDARARFDDKDAIAGAGRGLASAVSLPPSKDVAVLMADLAFVRAIAERKKDGKGAARDFALVHRLDPGRTLDPVKYQPEEIEAFEKAATQGAAIALMIEAPPGGEVWVDGASVGAAPASVEVSPGLHAITVTGPTLVTHGEIVEVKEAGGLAIDAAEASGTTIVHRLRRRLASATDDLARADAIAAILRAVGGQDAIVVARDASGALVTTTYSGKSGVLSEAKAADGRDARDIVKPLRPIKVKVRTPPEGDGPKVTPPPPVPWYRRRWVQATIGGTVIAAVLTSAIVVATQPTGDSPSSLGLEFEPSNAVP